MTIARTPAHLLEPMTDCYGMGWDTWVRTREILDDNPHHTLPGGTETAASEHLAQPNRTPTA